MTRGFGAKWKGWISKVVQGGSLCIRMNDENSTFFKPGKGLRQGYPLSPLLFNLVADVFSRMLMRAAKVNLITGLLTQSEPGGIISLQCADDTLLFLENNLDKAAILFGLCMWSMNSRVRQSVRYGMVRILSSPF